MDKYQKGIGLIELMLVLAIISVIIVLSTRYYLVVDLSRKVNKSVTDIEVIISASQEWWEDNNHNLMSLSNGMDDLINNGYLKRRYQINEWGGDITIKALSPNTIMITLQNIPGKACNNLANQFKLGTDPCNLNSQQTDFSICYDTNNTFTNCSIGD